MTKLTEPQNGFHAYESTACQHGLHERCRQRCKFCDNSCGCNCHAEKQAGMRAKIHYGLRKLYVGGGIISATEELVCQEVEKIVEEARHEMKKGYVPQLGRLESRIAELKTAVETVCALYERDCTGLVDSRVALIRERNR